MNNVTVIVPIYNIEHYVMGMLRDLHNQTYASATFLLIDDGSTDRTGLKIKNFLKIIQDSRFQYYFKEHGGVSDARNFGLDLTTSKYVIFLDGDDRICPTLVESYVFSIENSESDIEFFKLEKYKIERGNVIFPEESQLVYPDYKSDEILRQKNILNMLVKSEIYGHSVAYISRTCLWERIRFPKQYYLLEDLYALFNLIGEHRQIVGKVNNISKCYYISRPDSVIHSMSWSDLYETIVVQKKIRDDFLSDKNHIKRMNALILRTRLGHLIKAKKELNYNQKKRVMRLIVKESMTMNLTLRTRIFILLSCLLRTKES
ncbi:glycosyltransferase family 2 protein [Weissella cibaria]|uniref:glycosyltransferase family 2 protein n=1 Tax=Weissella cibaria TaxID=137591 RepID=UPI000BFFA854|nr:glycosyltransferase family A protein [Weissella cibaria]